MSGDIELKIFELNFLNLAISKREIPKIRGYISASYPEYDELHNHDGDKFIYRYPLIQYKVIGKTPKIIGINEGADILKEIEEKLEFVHIGDKHIDIYEKGMFYKKVKFGVSEKLHKYIFETPWMCLNQDNYKKFIMLGSDEKKKDLLERILIGNILSMSKRFRYTVNDKIQAKVYLKEQIINFKNQKMTAFRGFFETNFIIPDYLGIGKSVSRGFGSVRKVKTQNDECVSNIDDSIDDNGNV